MLLAVPSFADNITITLDNSSASGGSCTNCGPFGTITVTQQTANSVLVTETLASNVGFVNTGAGDSLDFSITGDPTIAISSLTSGFATTSPANKGDTGSFNYALQCTGCGSGASNAYYGTLSFIVSTSGTLTPAAFEVLNSKSFYVASDVILASGKTGNIESNEYSVVATPEPTSLLLFGSGFLGVVGVVRRKLFRKV
jgi:hypothetical protein